MLFHGTRRQGCAEMSWPRTPECCIVTARLASHLAPGFAEGADGSVRGSPAMRVRLILKLGQRGRKKLCAEYGERLVCVRYRYDEERRKHLETVELVIGEVDSEPRDPKLGGESIVGLRVAWQEVEIHDRVKTAGGRWDPARRLWKLRCGRVGCLAWRTESSESWTSIQKASTSRCKHLYIDASSKYLPVGGSLCTQSASRLGLEQIDS